MMIAWMLALLVPAAGTQETSDEAVRKAVERGLPYLEKEGLAWIKQRDCLSCHHVPFLLWSHEAAKARGFAPDERQLAEWTEWSRRESLAQRTKLKLTDAAIDALKADSVPPALLEKLAPLSKKNALKEADFVKELGKLLTPEELAAQQAAVLKHAEREKGDGGGLDTLVQLLLAGTYKGSESVDFARSTRLKILESQQADGSWKPGGQLPRMNRTEAEGAQLTTMWVALALSEDPEPKSKEGVDRALAFLKQAKPGDTAEGLALRLLVGKKFGEAETARKDLLARQNADGGWSWRSGGASDAFATGQALHALRGSGLPADDESVRKARKHLIDSQGEDGSWAVPPTALTSPSTAPERLKRLEPIYRYWGSAWATIGLLQTLPAKSRP